VTIMYFSEINFGIDIRSMHRKLINFFNRAVLRIFDLREYRVRWVRVKSSLGGKLLFQQCRDKVVLISLRL